MVSISPLLTVLLQVLEEEPLGGAELPGVRQGRLGHGALRLERVRREGREGQLGGLGRRARHEVEGDGAAVGLVHLQHVDQGVRRTLPKGVAAGKLKKRVK